MEHRLTPTRSAAPHEPISPEPMEEEPTKTQEKPKRFTRGWRFYASWGCLCLANIIAAIDSTIISVVLPTIADEIHATAIEAFWIGTSFLLAMTVFQPIFSTFSFIFGRRDVLLVALALFTAGSIMCALSKDIVLMLAGRVTQGVGAGGVQALTYVIVTDLVSLRERGKWMSLISLTHAVGTVIGPVIGGAFAKESWPWIFWINLPFCALSFIAIPLVLTLRKIEGSVSEKLLRFDWIGAAVFVGALTSVLIPITWGGISYEWDAYQTLVPLIIGLVGLVGFVVHIIRFAPRLNIDPLIRPSLFTTMTGLSAYFGTIVQGIIVWGALFYIPLYYEVVLGQTAMQAGISLFPFTATVTPSAAIVGIVITKTGKYRTSVWIGSALVAIGYGLMMLLGRDSKTVEWVMFDLVAGAGQGILYSALSFTAQASASDDNLSYAAGMYAFCRSLGQCIGVAVGGIVFQSSFKAKILKNPDPAFSSQADAWAKEASALAEVVRRLGPDEEAKKDAIIDGFVVGLRSVYLLLCIFAVISLVTSVLFIKQKSVDRVFKTDQGLIDNSSRNLGSDVEGVSATHLSSVYGPGQKGHDTPSFIDTPFDTPQHRLSVASVSDLVRGESPQPYYGHHDQYQHQHQQYQHHYQHQDQDQHQDHHMHTVVVPYPQAHAHAHAQQSSSSSFTPDGSILVELPGDADSASGGRLRSVSDAPPTLGPLEFEFEIDRGTTSRPSTAHASIPSPTPSRWSLRPKASSSMVPAQQAPPSAPSDQELPNHKRHRVSRRPLQGPVEKQSSSSSSAPRGAVSGPRTEFHRPLTRNGSSDNLSAATSAAGAWPAPAATGVWRPTSQGTSTSVAAAAATDAREDARGDIRRDAYGQQWERPVRVPVGQRWRSHG